MESKPGVGGGSPERQPARERWARVRRIGVRWTRMRWARPRTPQFRWPVVTRGLGVIAAVTGLAVAVAIGLTLFSTRPMPVPEAGVSVPKPFASSRRSLHGSVPGPSARSGVLVAGVNTGRASVLPQRGQAVLGGRTPQPSAGFSLSAGRSSLLPSPAPVGQTGAQLARGAALDSSARAAESARASAAAPPAAGTGGLALIAPPLAHARQLVGYGWAYAPSFGDWRFHPGVDLAAASGEGVAAAGAGRVESLNDDPLWGWSVRLDLGGGLTTVYRGLARVAVLSGQAVVAGQTLGWIGASPPAEAGEPPHVHWEIWYDNRPVNPATAGTAR